jgi:hypothetical protein
VLGTFIVSTTAFLVIVLIWAAHSVVVDGGHPPRSRVRTRIGVRQQLLILVVAYLIALAVVVLPALNLMGVIK